MRQALILLPVLSLAAEQVVHADTPALDSVGTPEAEANLALPPATEITPEPSAPVLAEGTLVVARADTGAASLLWSAIDHSDAGALQTALRSGAKVNVTREEGQTPLMAVAASGAVELLGSLVDARADLDAQDQRGFTALMFAAEARNTQAVELLLAAGADPNLTNAKGETALERLCYSVRYTAQSSGHEAANARQTERRMVLMDLVRVLLDRGANPNLFSSPKQNPLVMAASYGEVALVEMLLHSGADVHGRSQADLESAERYGDNGGVDATKLQWQTPLQAVLAGGNRARAEKIFLADGGILSPAARENLRSKASTQDVAIVDRLIEAGATTGDGLQRFALLDAASGPSVGGGRVELVKRLVKSGLPVQVSDVGRRLVLTDAIQQEETRLAAAVAEKPVQVAALPASKTKVQFSSAAPLNAKSIRIAATAKVLPAKPAPKRATARPKTEKAFDANYGVPRGWTPLVQAARSGDVEVVQFLLSQGADPNTRDSDGKTPLMHLCGAGRARWVRGLPAERARILATISEEDYRMASRVVSYSEKQQWREWSNDGDVAIVRALLKSGADINARDKDNRTPLMYAARRSSTVVVRELIKQGADVNLVDNVGKTALMQVINGGRYIAAEQWVSPVLHLESREARKEAIRVRTYEATEVAQKALERYDLHRNLTIQEAERDDSLILCELRRAKTDLNVRDINGRTALDLAVAAQQQHAVRWIVADVY